MSEDNTFEAYVAFVERVVKRSEQLGGLVTGDTMITPANVNYALAKWYEVSLGLCSEYERVKRDQAKLELNFQRWYDIHFEKAQAQLLAEYAVTKTKPSIKEIEVRTRTSVADEYYEWQEKILVAEMKTRTYLRLMSTVDRYDKILTTLSQNMRSEMSVLTLENRMNSDTSDRNVRTAFPDDSTILVRKATRHLDATEE
jgi:hypothetical protein